MKYNSKEQPNHNFQKFFNKAKEVEMTADEQAVVWREIQADLQARIICEKAKEVSMTSLEKTQVWNNIKERTANMTAHTTPAFVDSEFTEEDGLKDSTSNIEAAVTYSSRITSTLRRRSAYRLFMGTVMFGLVIASGTITAIAGQAMPGSTLYPIKTGIIERVQMRLASSVEEKADLELKLAVSRLLEAETLAIGGNLDEKTLKSVEKRFGSHVTRVLSYAGKMHTNKDSFGAAELSSRLESTLMAHKDILKQIETQDSSRSIASINQSLEKSLGYASEIRVSAETYNMASSSDNVRLRIAAEKANVSIQGSIVAAENSLKQGSHSNIDSTAEKQIAEAKDYSAEGLAKLINGAYGDALILFGEAQRTASQVSLEAEIIERINSVERMSATRRGASKINPSSLRILPVPQLEPLASTIEKKSN